MVGRPRKLKIGKKSRTKAFGPGAKGARTPGQIKAALMRDIKRKRRPGR